MITGEIKNKIDKIWENIWTGGITNPLSVIEQLTYLMFIKALDDKELEAESFETVSKEKMPKIFPQDAKGQSMRWSKFKDKDAREMYEIISQRVFPFIKTLGDNGEKEETAFSRYMKDAMFMFPEGKKQLLQRVITGLDDLYEHDIKGLDMLGDVYEYMLGKIATSGTNGQFRTPKHIRDMMVELLAPTPDDRICDPACGTSGFLVSCAEYIRKHYENIMTAQQWDFFAGEAFTGYDMDYTMLRISAMNLMLHAISNPDVNFRDSLSKQNAISSKYDVMLANPPFKGSVDTESINDDLKAICNTKKTELLFLALFIRMLKKGGRCSCIVPDGVLFGASKAHKAIRQELIENHNLQAVISMPSGVFKPYAGVSTAVLVFTKTGAGGTDKVWFYDMTADGFSLDDKRSPIDDNDIADIIKRFHSLSEEEERKRTDKSFFVPKQEIVDNDYDLSINKYKEVEYTPVEYPPTSEIMAKILELDQEAAKELAELKKMLEN